MSAHEQTHSAPHAHTNYFKVWVTLVILLVISVLGPMIGIKAITLITAFGIAGVKAFMVASKFMHLNTEKKYIVYFLLICLFLMIFFFFTIAPDIMSNHGTNWRMLETNKTISLPAHE